MTILTTTTGIWVLAGIALLASVAAIYFSSFESFDVSRSHTFLTVFSGLGILITFLFYYNLVELQQEQIEITSIQQEGSLNTSIRVSLSESLIKASDLLPAFIGSINPLIKGYSGEDSTTPKALTYRTTISQKIFTIWRDYLTLDAYIAYDTVSYICGFLQWASSEQLFEQWLIDRIDYPCNAIRFGDLLFEYGLSEYERTPEGYTKLAKEFISNSKYTDIKCKKRR